jgi:hypothetical protein
MSYLPLHFSLAPILISLPILFVLSTVIYRLVFHPLSRVPGPKVAGISTLWLAYHVRQGKSATWEPDLHKKYGPVVRIAPNEVLVCSEEGVRAIYGELLQVFRVLINSRG